MTTEALEYESPATEETPPPAEYDVLNPPAEAIADFQGRVRWFVRLQWAKRKREEDLDQIKARIEELEPHLIEEMAENGVENCRVDGLTVYQTQSVKVSKKSDENGVTMDVVCAALRACGMDYMVKEQFSASSLTAKVKEMRQQGIEIPETLAKVVNIYELVKLVARK